MSVIEVENVTKTFAMEKSKILVLDNVSFSVGNDEFVCLVGPSGCGKSTILRIIAGLEKADSAKYCSEDKLLLNLLLRLLWSFSFSVCYHGKPR